MSDTPAIEEFLIKVGDYVRLDTSRIADPHTVGRVVQIDKSHTFNGINTTVYVRWFNCDGKPDDDPACFHPAELFKIMNPGASK